MNPLKAYEVHTSTCRYTMTLYRTDDGKYLAEYCGHHDGKPGPLVRVGDMQPVTSTLAHHQAHYLQTLLNNCLAEIARESGPTSDLREIPLTHSAPGHECATAPV